MQACRNGHIHVATFLINHGADVSARNSSGYTALYMAAEIGSLELVQLLMGKGATVDEQNPGKLFRYLIYDMTGRISQANMGTRN